MMVGADELIASNFCLSDDWCRYVDAHIDVSDDWCWYVSPHIAFVSDFICCLFSLPVLIRDGEGGTVHASVDWPPTPYDVCDSVQPACDMFIHFSGHITHCLFLSI